ncbi:MAG: DUF366 family protein [Bdellovibrionales bacterium]|nr:DUF366 family protein [Bdellovibrionales bacterium]
MKVQFIDRELANEIAYDGSQLRSLYAYLEHGILGDSLIAWVGPCEVSLDHMVDGEDVLAKASIRGARMVHFVLEKFGATLPEMVAVQRLLASTVKDILSEKSDRLRLRREGDDIYVGLPDGEGKLSISIATVSPVSGLIHFAVNVTNKGTPVKTASLEDLGVAARDFADQVLKQFGQELSSAREATQKVKWVR